MLGPAGRLPNLGAHAMKLILQRLSEDWQSAYGHGLVLAETDVDPAVHRGTLYEASGWISLGLTAGYSRQGGQSTEAHDQCKRILVRPLRRDARRILRRCDELATKWCRKSQASGRSTPELKSRYEERSPMVDCRRAPGRKHSLGGTLTILVLAQLSGFFSQEE